MPREVRTARQIALGFVLLYTLAGLALSLGVYLIGDRALRDEVDDRVKAEVITLHDVHLRLGVNGLQQSLKRRDDRGVNNLGYLLLDPRGKRLGGELETAPPTLGWARILFVDGEETNPARALTIRLKDGNRLTVAMELEPTQDFRRTTLWLFALGTLVMLIGGIAGGLLLSQAIRRRLDAMNDTALAIIGGDMSQRVPEGKRQDEFQRLAATLNRMLDRNSALIDNLRQVSSDIAHDLRTPIARLRQRLDRAAALAPDSDALHQEIGAAIEQSDAILSLFAALLRITEVESGTLRRYFRSFDISAAMRLLGESYGPAAEDSGRTLDCRIEDGLTVIGDEELVAQAIINILENALRHTPEGTRIVLRLDSPDPDRARVTVEDDGPGIPDEMVPHILQRFVRSDKSRASAGFGLGLNLVNAVVTIHDGTIAVRNLDPGLSVRILLPRVHGADAADG